jgi:hypothetical protein
MKCGVAFPDEHNDRRLLGCRVFDSVGHDVINAVAIQIRRVEAKPTAGRQCRGIYSSPGGAECSSKPR